MENGKLKEGEAAGLKNEKIRSVRNVLTTYLFVSVISARPYVFAAICASFPFIIPVIFESDSEKDKLLSKSITFGVPGILVSVLYLIFFGTYSTAAWLIPSVFALSMCLLYGFIRKRIKSDKSVTVRAAITVAVCLIAFI